VVHAGKLTMSDALPKLAVLRGPLAIGVILLGLALGGRQAWGQEALPQDAADLRIAEALKQVSADRIRETTKSW
jgi:hypothetical protein